MTITVFYKTYASDCTAGCGNQLLTRLEQPITKTGRCWFRLSHGAENYALLFSNQVDSTYDEAAKALNQPVSTVKYRTRKALGQLKTLLEGEAMV